MPVDRPCPICQIQETESIWKTQVFRDHPLRIVICRRCALVYANPMYTDQEKHAIAGTPREVHRARLATHSLDTARRRMVPRAERCMSLLSRFVQPNQRVLEIGCGEGTLLELLKGYGAKVTGVEMDPEGAEYVRERLGVQVSVGRFEELTLSERFDAVASVHVIEHVFDPVEALSRMRRLLKPSGILFLETPNILRPKVGPTRLFNLPHNYYFSPASLARCLDAAGFDSAYVRVFNRDSFQIVARPRAAGGKSRRPQQEDWREVAATIRQYALKYYLSGQFLWRKLPLVKNAWMYRIHRDVQAKSA